MKTRIITAVVAILFMFGIMALFNTVVFDIALCLLCLVGIHEVYGAFQLKAPHIYVGMALYTVFVMLSHYVLSPAWFWPVTYAAVIYLAVCAVLQSEKIDAAKLGGTVLYAALILVCFYSLLHLKLLLPLEQYGYDAVYYVFLVCAFAWGGDTLAYFVGSACGKHKMCPKVSPKKTWEGAVGGFLGSMLLGVLVTWIYFMLHGTVFGLTAETLGWQFYLFIALLGGVASVLGVFGDLFASVIKRQQGIKDYGTLFPGHGGVMDRFDSVVFIAPLISMGITIALPIIAA